MLLFLARVFSGTNFPFYFFFSWKIVFNHFDGWVYKIQCSPSPLAAANAGARKNHQFHSSPSPLAAAKSTRSSRDHTTSAPQIPRPTSHRNGEHPPAATLSADVWPLWGRRRLGLFVGLFIKVFLMRLMFFWCRRRSSVGRRARGGAGTATTTGGCHGTNAASPAPRSTFSRRSTNAWTLRWVGSFSGLHVGGESVLFWHDDKLWLGVRCWLALGAELQGEPVQGLLVQPQREDH